MTTLGLVGAAIASAGMGLALVMGAVALNVGWQGRHVRRRVQVLVQTPPGSETTAMRAPARVRRILHELDISTDPDLLWRTWWAVVFALAVIGLLGGGPLVAALSVVAVVGLTMAGVVTSRDRRATHLDNELPAALDALGSTLRSGASMARAIDEIRTSVRGPLREELDVMVRSIENGESLLGALTAWRERCPSSAVRMTVAAVSLASEAGGSQARTVDGVASTLRARLAVKRELTALTAQARLSAGVIAAAPIVFTLLTGFGEDGSLDFLFRSPAGLACLAVGGALDTAGGCWMLAIARRAT